MQAAQRIDDGDEARVEVSLIKFYAAEVLNDVIDRAIQVHGGLGMTEDTPLAIMWRQARAGADLRRPGRGAQDGRRAPHPAGVRRRRHLALHVILEGERVRLEPLEPRQEDALWEVAHDERASGAHARARQREP